MVLSGRIVQKIILRLKSRWQLNYDQNSGISYIENKPGTAQVGAISKAQK